MAKTIKNACIRAAGRTALVHTVFVVVAVAAYNLFQWKFGGPWWLVRQVLKLVEWPISGAVDWVYSANIVPFVPLEYTSNSALYSSMISEASVYSLFGGIFYGCLAAAIVLVRAKLRPRAQEEERLRE